jgi:hypothetical protein
MRYDEETEEIRGGGRAQGRARGPAAPSGAGGGFAGGEAYDGPLRRKPMEPLQIAGIVLTLIIHGSVFAVVARGETRPKDDGPVINVMVTQIVRKGIPPKEKALPKRYEPPKVTAPIKGPTLTEDITAKAAPKEKKRDREAEDDKVLRERMRKLRSSMPPTPDVEPEGQRSGSESGTATTGSQGDPCATAISNVVHDNWKIPETISESQAGRLNLKLKIKVGKDGSLTKPEVVGRGSGNTQFDEAVISAIEKAGSTGETKSVVSKECNGKSFSPVLNLSGKALTK